MFDQPDSHYKYLIKSKSINDQKVFLHPCTTKILKRIDIPKKILTGRLHRGIGKSHRTNINKDQNLQAKKIKTFYLIIYFLLHFTSPSQDSKIPLYIYNRYNHSRSQAQTQAIVPIPPHTPSTAPETALHSRTPDSILTTCTQPRPILHHCINIHSLCINIHKHSTAFSPPSLLLPRIHNPLPI